MSVQEPRNLGTRNYYNQRGCHSRRPAPPSASTSSARSSPPTTPSGKHGGRVATRFPPEPNGYLHIGHAKSICLNFGIARDFGGTCNLRFDDTNPVTEDVEYVESIQDDVRWLGFDWDDRLFYASDYFEQLYDCAEPLIQQRPRVRRRAARRTRSARLAAR